MDSSREKWINIFGQAALQLLQHSLFRRGTMNGSPLKLKIVVEAGEELATIQVQLLQSFIQIEKIAVLAPLQKRPQLRPEEFFRLERDDLRLPSMPAAIHREWVAFKSEQADMLAGIDLDLELELRARVCFGSVAEDEMNGMAGLLSFTVAEPR